MASVQELAVVPASCSLSRTGIEEQLSRYRELGQDARVLKRERRRLTIRLADGIADSLVEEIVEIERGCCPFFALTWDPSIRSLTVSIDTAEHEPALQEIGHALGIQTVT
jgi:hypothetical protein